MGNGSCGRADCPTCRRNVTIFVFCLRRLLCGREILGHFNSGEACRRDIRTSRFSEDMKSPVRGFVRFFADILHLAVGYAIIAAPFLGR